MTDEPKQDPEEVYTGVMNSLLDDAEELLSSRNGSHGDPVENHEHIAALWSAYLGVEVTPRNVADMCILLKLSRGQVGGADYDHYADTIGYALIAAEVADTYGDLLGYEDDETPEVATDGGQDVDYDLSVLDRLQDVHAAWSEENFGDQSSTLPLLGVAEEVGELNHAHLKGLQGIREDDETTGTDAKLDAVGDVVLYLIDYCQREGLSFSDAVQTAVEEVHGREWDSELSESVE